jgi:hypothetical protein
MTLPTRLAERETRSVKRDAATGGPGGAVQITPRGCSAQEERTGGARPALALGNHAGAGDRQQTATLPMAVSGVAADEIGCGTSGPGWAATHEGQWAGVVR